MASSIRYPQSLPSSRNGSKLYAINYLMTDTMILQHSSPATGSSI